MQIERPRGGGLIGVRVLGLELLRFRLLRFRLLSVRPLVAAGVAVAAAAAAVAAEEAPALRYSAPVVVSQPAPFVQLPLPVSVYAHSRQPGLADLRLLDAGGQRVPFALLAPRDDAVQAREQLQSAKLYALPPGPVGTSLPSSLELVVQGDRISLRQRGGVAAAGSARPTVHPGAGWLFDLGERAADQAPPQRLRLRWSGPAEFSAGFTIDSSDNLRQWRRGGSGQLMALASSNGALTQPLVMLDGAPGRFVRLVWADAGHAPVLTGADAIVDQPESVQRDALTELRLNASVAAPSAGDAAAARALQIDLGGVLPLRQLDLALPAGTQVIPLRVQQRSRDNEPWREAAQAVIYRIERDGAVSRSPPVALNLHTRYLRLLPDGRAPAIDATTTPVILRAALARLVFATQGTPPYRLLVGAADAKGATPGALPIETLVPKLDDERARFGRAELGAFTEQAEVAQQVARDEALAAWRPRLLWAVLLVGVLGLGLMVWRLARSRPS
ncbi:DUF3999 family protein [Aquabacterium sp.]|uniref:DUF3999 family protein n=1 Tax=Aquabacterium sp. TaxID=1872578 RepID=UPI002C382A75|nr:DUF3999 family protein [Aquabacterium sp.]HSW07826.1 DUF3999 family protein [Aquabacterium sp.]